MRVDCNDPLVVRLHTAIELLRRSRLCAAELSTRATAIQKLLFPTAWQLSAAAEETRLLLAAANNRQECDDVLRQGQHRMQSIITGPAAEFYDVLREMLKNAEESEWEFVRF